MKNRQHYK